MRFFFHLISSFFRIFFYGRITGNELIEFLDFSGEFYRNNTLLSFRKNVRKIDSWNEVSFKKLFLRRIRVISYPSNDANKGGVCFLKKFLTKVLFLDGRKSIYTDYLINLIFSRDCLNRICVRNSHVASVYSFNFPDFKIDDALYSSGLFKSKITDCLLLFFSFIAGDKFVDNSKGITMLTNFFSFTAIKIYKRNHPNRYLVWHLHDRLSEISKITFERLAHKLKTFVNEGVLDEVSSYSSFEANLLGITYRPNAVSFSAMSRFNGQFIDYLTVFVGSSSRNGSRQEAIKKVNQLCTQYFCDSLLKIKELLVDERSKAKKIIPYEEYLSFVSKSLFVVDLKRISDNEGISFRVAEALALGKKIITDRHSVVRMPFYHYSRFYILDKDQNLREFMSVPFKPLDKDEELIFNSDKMFDEYKIRKMDKLPVSMCG